MTNKDRFANKHNLSTFAKNNPKISIILAFIIIPIFPVVYMVTHTYIALKEYRMFKYFFYDWKGIAKMPKVLFDYINTK